MNKREMDGWGPNDGYLADVEAAGSRTKEALALAAVFFIFATLAGSLGYMAGASQACPATPALVVGEVLR